MLNREKGKADKEEFTGVRCGECGTELKESDKECPNCGTTKKLYSKAVGGGKVDISGGLVSAVHTAQMSLESWAILGLILGFVIPPTFYAVFSMLTIWFWYKLLIWLGVILIVFRLTRSYRIIMLLRFIADKAYGKHRFKM